MGNGSASVNYFTSEKKFAGDTQPVNVGLGSMLLKKDCGMPSSRNNRITVTDFLNRSCAFNPRF
jgi:hypothetical protein